MLDFVCGPLPLVAELGVFVPQNSNGQKSYYIAQDPKAWPSHSNISYSFIDEVGPDGNEIRFVQEDLVTKAITEYTRFTNVNLVPVPKGEEGSANIRITFKDTKAVWSAIGTDALKIPKGEATMNLGFLSRKPNDSERKEFYYLTLHQFGHAFGLAHEWDRGWATLIKEDRSEAVRQHKAAFEYDGTSNFPEPDKESIMKFFVPANFTRENKDFALESGLSPKDKAWLTLIYPGKANPIDEETDEGDEEVTEEGANTDEKTGKKAGTKAEENTDQETGVLKSLIVLGLPLEDSSRILLASTVSEMRFSYQKYISTKHGDKLGAQVIQDVAKAWGGKAPDLKPDSHVLEGKVTGITPSIDYNNEDDLYDSIAAAVLHPDFHRVIANVVNHYDDEKPDTQHILMPQRPVWPPTFPGTVVYGLNDAASPDVQNFIGPFISILGPLLGKLIFSGLPNGAASGINPNNLGPEIQQGIFDMFTRFLRNPVFIKVVQGVASDMIENLKE